MLGERGSSDVPGQVYVGTMRDWHLPVAEWQRYARSPMLGTPVHWRPRLPWRLRCAGTTVRRVYGTLAPKIAVAPPVRRDYGAPGLRYTGAHDCRGVYGAPGLRCAGTTVRRDYATKGRPRLPCASGAPGLRCAGTTVLRGQQFHRRGPAAPLFPRTAWNNQRRRTPRFLGRVP